MIFVASNAYITCREYREKRSETAYLRSMLMYLLGISFYNSSANKLALLMNSSASFSKFAFESLGSERCDKAI